MQWLRRYGDPLLGAVLAVGWVVELTSYHPADYPLAALVGVVAAGTLAVRRRIPLAAYVVLLAMSWVTERLDPSFAHNGLCPFAVLLIGLYTLGAHTRGMEAWLSVLGVAAAVAGIATSNHQYTPTAMLFFCALCALPWGAGLAVRLRLDRLHDLEARNAVLREEAEHAVAAERSRIARELHDVVSHAIAVTVLQSRGGAKLVGRDAAAVRSALDAIEQTNTAALADMRRLLSLLREQDADTTDDEPAPGLDRLDRLAADVRAAGVPVEVSVLGEPLPVPPGLDASAYRIVQEALTNVLKHGGDDARVHVEIRYDAHGLALAVTSTGTGSTTSTSSGHGLTGIRERAAVAGGTVDAGPRDGGWVVHARLPYLVPAS